MPASEHPTGILTLDEWLLQATPRAEFVDGVETLQRTWHTETAQATTRRHAWACSVLREVLNDALKAAGSPCKALNEGPVVRVAENTRGRMPDVSIVCDDDTDAHEDDDSCTIEPCVVVEVLSQATAKTDLGVKVTEYLNTDSIEHYLVFDPADNSLAQYQSQHDTGLYSIRRYAQPEETVALDRPGIEFTLARLHALL